MIDRVVRGILASGIPAEDLDVLVLRDALWLAVVVRRLNAETTATGTPEAADDGTVRQQGAGVSPAAASESPSAEVRLPQSADPLSPSAEVPSQPVDGRPADRRLATDGRELYADYVEGGTGAQRKASALSMPAPAPLPTALTLTRALRPFRHAHRASGHEALDPEATVEATAAAGGNLLQLAFRRQREPRFRAHIVVDDSPSMSVWADAIASFGLVLHRSSSFRNVSTWTLTESHNGPALATPQGRVARPPWLASTDESVVVLATDARADRWRSDEWWAVVRHWASQTSIALLNPLPVTWWQRTGLPPDAVLLRAVSRVRTNLDLEGSLPRRLRTRAASSPATALPVLALDPNDVQDWGRTVASSNPAGCLGVVLLDRTPNRHAAPRVGGSEAVAGFRQLATAAARRLAVLLSACDVHTIETMRVVQGDLVPNSAPGDLAQVLASGFVDTVPGVSGHVFRIDADAQAELHRELLAHDAYDVHRSLRRALDRRAGDDTFRVLFDDPSGIEQLDPSLRILARASVGALTSAGLGSHQQVGQVHSNPVSPHTNDAIQPTERAVIPSEEVSQTQPTAGRNRSTAQASEQLFSTTHAAAVRDVALTSLGDQLLLASASLDGTIQIWDLRQQSRLHVLRGHGGGVHRLAFNHLNGELALASSSWDRSVRVWNVAEGREVAQSWHHGDQTFGVSWINEGIGGSSVLSTGFDGNIFVWNPLTDESRRIGYHKLWALASGCWTTTAGRRLVASAGLEGKILLREVAKPSVELVIRKGGTSTWALATLIEGATRILASSTEDGHIAVWDLDLLGDDLISGRNHRPQPLAQTRVAGRRVRSVAAGLVDSSPLIAVGDERGTVACWPVSDDEARVTFSVPTGEIWSVALLSTSDATLIAVGGSDGKAVVHSISLV